MRNAEAGMQDRRAEITSPDDPVIGDRESHLSEGRRGALHVEEALLNRVEALETGVLIAIKAHSLDQPAWRAPLR
jgi:hypothetical protein